MNIVDAIIILFLLLGAVWGFKNGVIKTGVAFVGTILLIIAAWYLKNPIASFMYLNFPFINFGGVFSGLTVINILFYEALAFIIVFAVLGLILSLIIKISGVLEGILKMTIVLAIPSKILGAILGALEMFLFLFIGLFIFTQFSFSTEVTMGSKYTQPILNNTPFLSNIVGDTFNAFQEIYSLKDKYENTKDKAAYNEEALTILLKYNIITEENAIKLAENGKLKVNDATNIIEEHFKNYGEFK